MFKTILSRTGLIINLHERAKKATKVLLQKEWELIQVLQQVIQHQVYREYKYPNLYKYLTLALGLSESRAYDYSVVARASLKFTKLELALDQGKISVSKARRIIPVLNKDNQEEWITKAHLNTHRSLEKLVAGVNPEVSNGESIKYVSANQVEVRIIMTEVEYQDFKRAQDLLCQKQKRQVSMRSTVIHTAKAFLEKEDPVIKAMRNQTKELKKVAKQGKSSGTCRKPKVRRPIPTQIFHQVQLRDKGRCQEKLPNGQKCQESKWIDIHHIKPINQGGDNDLNNLTTLCKSHHRLEHWNLQKPISSDPINSF